MSITQDLRNAFRKGENGAIKLIIINVAIFIIANVAIAIGESRGYDFGAWLALPSLPDDIITHPWTFITYMFFHTGLWHMVFNMLMLYFMGRIFTEYMNSLRLISVYLLGGICGGLLFVALYNLYPSLGYRPLIGASAGVMAIAVSIATVIPNYPVGLFLMGTIRLKYLALIIFVLTSLLDLSSNTGGKVAHIGGAIFGVLYGMQQRRGKDMSLGMGRLLNGISSLFRPVGKTKMRVTHRRGRSDEAYNMSKVQKQQQVDEILDKISKSGYESLSKEEKDMLFKMSNDKNK